MRRESEGAALTGIGLLLTIGLVIMGIVVADRHREAVLEAKKAERAEARLAALIAEGVLVVPRVDALPPDPDPFAEAWSRAPSLEVPVVPQAITMPALREASVSGVQVQALSDGARILWRLSWTDPSRDAAIDVARFSDAVALQFPVSPDAAFTMGGPQSRVQILQWKAIWQDDVDDHYQDVQDLHPNYWADLYWFATGAFPYPVPAAFRDTTAKQWFVAYSAGNPMADFDRKVPVDELVAEGFGTLTAQEKRVTTGRGVWRDGRWAVVFARPLASDDPLDYQFHLGARGSVAVAVWEGSAGNVGGRKHWSNWVTFEVQI